MAIRRMIKMKKHRLSGILSWYLATVWKALTVRGQAHPSASVSIAKTDVKSMKTGENQKSVI